LAKGWLIALLEEAPLDHAPSILTGDLTRDGPQLCEAVVRALADDEDLRRLEVGGALELLASQVGELTAADGVEATARAVDVLQAVIWSALRSELPRADADQIFDLAERLALVVELIRAAALRRSSASEPSLEATPRARRSPGAKPPSSWRDALDEQISGSFRSGSPLSLVFAILEDADRVHAAEQGSANDVYNRFARAVRQVLRRQDILACEPDGRAWVIARDTGRAGAQALGVRIIDAVREAGPWRGAPLAVSVGLAVLGEDGNDSATMIDAAELGGFSASASGIGIAGASGPGGSPAQGGPPGSGPRLVG
jgi:GGDEF domain-containing protein